MRSPLARHRQATGAALPATADVTLGPSAAIVDTGLLRRLRVGHGPQCEERSLFVVSLPRSLSSLLYRAACRSLQFEEPFWTSSGEILNRDRVPRRHRRLAPEDGRFTLLDSEPALFGQMTAYLERTARPRGFAYKDVVQPFVVAGWPGLADFEVIRIRRDVAEVAYAMLKRQWAYPSRAATLHREPPWSIIEGLVRADAVIDALPGETLHFAQAILSHEPLEEVLRSLYPEARLAPVRYIDRGFVRTRTRLAAERHDSELFCEIERAVEIVRERISFAEPGTAFAPALV